MAMQGDGGSILSALSSTSQSVTTGAPASSAFVEQRVYDYTTERGLWEEREYQKKLTGEDPDVVLARQRVHHDFQPIIAVRKGSAEGDGGDGKSLPLRLAYALFSSRLWDMLYATSFMIWTVLVPLVQQESSSVSPSAVAALLELMVSAAAIPALGLILLKGIAGSRISAHSFTKRSCKSSVTFTLASKCIPVPFVASCWPPPEPPEMQESMQHGNGNADDIESSINNLEVQEVEDRGEEIVNERSAAPENEGDSENVAKNQWQCVICKRVNTKPASWNGKPGKELRVVFKRKEVAKDKIYAEFLEVKAVPRCSRCDTPFNYVFRSDRLSTEVATGLSTRPIDHSAPADGTRIAGNNSASSSKLENGQDTIIDHRLPHITEPTAEKIRGRWQSLPQRLKTQILGRRRSMFIDPDPQKRLFNSSQFREEVQSLYAPQLPRRRLAAGETYSIGDRVETTASASRGWTSGVIVGVRTTAYTSVYDVNLSGGDEARHVYPHMLRFEQEPLQSLFVTLLYAEILLLLMLWPLLGASYFRKAASFPGGVSDMSRSDAISLAAPLTAVGTINAVAVGCIFAHTLATSWRRHLGPTLSLCAILFPFYILPWGIMIALGVALQHKLETTSNGSEAGPMWLTSMLIPLVLLSCAGAIYAGWIQPIYRRIWLALTPLWLLFFLLLSIRLDGEDRGWRGASTMKYMGIFFPMQLFAATLCVMLPFLPHIWNVNVDPSLFSPPMPRLRHSFPVITTKDEHHPGLADQALQENVENSIKQLTSMEGDSHHSPGRDPRNEPAKEEKKSRLVAPKDDDSQVRPKDPLGDKTERGRQANERGQQGGDLQADSIPTVSHDSSTDMINDALP